MTAVLEASRLYRFYHAGDEETLALQGISLALHAGEMVAVVGPSGSGKSTLLACLAGLVDPDGGTVTIDGNLLTRIGPASSARLRAQYFGVLLQGSNLIDHLTVEENIAIVQGIHGTKHRRTPLELLEQLGIENLARSLPKTLSGGETARAGLAVALANDPTVLLADEPTGELDDDAEASVIELMATIIELGIAVLVVTHSDAVAAAAGRVIAMRDGQLVS